MRKTDRLAALNIKLQCQAAGLVLIADWIEDPRQSIVKPELAGPNEGLYHYLWIKESTKTLIAQERNHINRDVLLKIWFSKWNLLSPPNSLIRSAEAHYNKNMRNKHDFLTWHHAQEK